MGVGQDGRGVVELQRPLAGHSSVAIGGRADGQEVDGDEALAPVARSEKRLDSGLGVAHDFEEAQDGPLGASPVGVIGASSRVDVRHAGSHPSTRRPSLRGGRRVGVEAVLAVQADSGDDVTVETDDAEVLLASDRIVGQGDNRHSLLGVNQVDGRQH